mmetsp:Transcript_53081/g.126907  ORF Transcript_53081/g.126907 Transcript_53081/m.126907 type:complete len:365 (+) Transcript_53081:1188-2282(+)
MPWPLGQPSDEWQMDQLETTQPHVGSLSRQGSETEGLGPLQKPSATLLARSGSFAHHTSRHLRGTTTLVQTAPPAQGPQREVTNADSTRAAEGDVKRKLTFSRGTSPYASTTSASGKRSGCGSPFRAETAARASLTVMLEPSGSRIWNSVSSAGSKTVICARRASACSARPGKNIAATAAFMDTTATARASSCSTPASASPRSRSRPAGVWLVPTKSKVLCTKSMVLRTVASCTVSVVLVLLVLVPVKLLLLLLDVDVEVADVVVVLVAEVEEVVLDLVEVVVLLRVSVVELELVEEWVVELVVSDVMVALEELDVTEVAVCVEDVELVRVCELVEDEVQVLLVLVSDVELDVRLVVDVEVTVL